MKKINPLVLGVGTGGGLSVLVQVAAKSTMVQTSPNFVLAKVREYPGISAMLAGVAGAFGLKYVLKRKDAFIPALLGATAASLPAVVGEAKSILGFSAPSMQERGLGVAVAEQRGFGAPAVELFGPASPTGIELYGASHGATNGNYNPAVYGGATF